MHDGDVMTLTNITADSVGAYLSHNRLAPAGLLSLIGSTNAALARTGAAVSVVMAAPPSDSAGFDAG